VQVVVVGFDEPSFSGELSAEFSRLRDAGIVRLIDLLIVSHVHAGALEVLAPPPGLPADSGRLAAAVLGRPEDSGEIGEGSRPTDAHDPTWSLAEAIPVGATAAVAIIEHTWAAPLRAAIQRSGGAALGETWLAAEDLELLDALLAGPEEDAATTRNERTGRDDEERLP
jgi:hypothetical protein